MNKTESLSSFGIATRSYRSAFSLLFSRKLIWFIIFPILLNIVLMVVGVYATSWFSDFIKPIIDSNVHDIWWLSWLAELSSSAYSIFLRVILFYIYMYFGGYVIIAFMAPVYSILSDKVEEITTGIKTKFSFTQFLKDVAIGVMLALRNFSIELLLGVVLFFVGMIPIIGFVAPVIMFFISSYFYGFSFVYYNLERKRETKSGGVNFMKQNRGFVVGIGAILTLSLMIPFLRFIIPPFISLLSVIAATVGYLKIEGRVE